jgi:hypothetical protein
VVVGLFDVAADGGDQVVECVRGARCGRHGPDLTPSAALGPSGCAVLDVCTST